MPVAGSTSLNDLGVRYPDGSQQTIAGGFPPGTSMLFQQSAAPTGWTKNTLYDNYALRVSAGAVGAGGSNGFTSAFGTLGVSGTTNATSLSQDQLPAHSHSATDSGHVHSITAAVGSSNTRCGIGCGAGTQNGTTSTGYAALALTATGGGGGHVHGFSGVSLGINVAYVDTTICVKD